MGGYGKSKGQNQGKQLEGNCKKYCGLGQEGISGGGKMKVFCVWLEDMAG